MTDINPVQNGPQQTGPEKSPKKTPFADKSFQQAFNRAIDNMEPSDMKNSPPGALTELPPGNMRPGIGASDLAEKADQALQSLDRYSEKLGDASVSLKNLEPALQQLKEDAGRLIEEAENSPYSDSDLKRIAQEFAVTARTEYIKFQRGDYL